MLSRPSEPLLRWLRQLLKDRKLNASAVAEAAGLPRPRARKILAGADPMTVDELLQISQALELNPGDLGMAGLEAPTGAPAKEAQAEEAPVEPAAGVPGVDPWGNHPEQLFRVGFTLGCDFFFLARSGELTDSGVPASVLERYEGRDLPIKLDAAYHQYNNPRYTPEGVTLTLSFDALYECRFPWSAIHQVIFFPAAPEPPPEGSDEEDEPPSRPHLRLVE